jgi:hypothetical protein
VTPELYRRIRDEELVAIGARPQIERAAQLFDELILGSELADFLTLPAYAELLRIESSGGQAISPVGTSGQAGLPVLQE